MKLKLLFVSMLTALTPLGAMETVQLNLRPERDRVLKGRDADVVFKVDLAGIEAKTERRSPINLVVVLDRSGSMEGAKIEKARQAACVAIDQLAPTDTFSLVAYDSSVNVIVPAQAVENPEQLKREVRRIESGGSTALYAGVREGSEQLRKYLSDRNVNRILLLSDGLANVGPSSPADLVRLGKELRGRGMSVSTVGLGDDYNENLMVGLAEASNANYYYVKDTETLPKIFAEELGQIKSIIARNIRITIELPDGVNPVEVIGYPEIKFRDRKAEITVGEFYGAQKRSFLVRCKVPDPKAEEMEVGQVRLAYLDEKLGKEANQSGATRIRFTEDREASDKSVNGEVALSNALATNASVREEALKLQDAGRPKEAAKLLSRQAQAAAAQAPVLGSDALKKEAETLQQAASELESKGSFDNRSRKVFQYDNYKQKHQKN